MGGSIKNPHRRLSPPLPDAGAGSFQLTPCWGRTVITADPSATAREAGGLRGALRSAFLPPPRLAPTLLAVADGPCSDLHLRRSHPDAGSTRGNGEIECRGCRVGAIVVLSTSCPIDNDAKYLKKLARDAVHGEPLSGAEFPEAARI